MSAFLLVKFKALLNTVLDFYVSQKARNFWTEFDFITFSRRAHIHGFNVYGSLHRKNIPIYIQQDATLTQFILSGNCCTCFGWYLHPSSAVHTTVSTASGICHTVTATCRCLFHDSGR
jgi:hypothetical protein